MTGPPPITNEEEKEVGGTKEMCAQPWKVCGAVQKCGYQNKEDDSSVQNKIYGGCATFATRHLRHQVEE